MRKVNYVIDQITDAYGWMRKYANVHIVLSFLHEIFTLPLTKKLYAFRNSPCYLKKIKINSVILAKTYYLTPNFMLYLLVKPL